MLAGQQWDVLLPAAAVYLPAAVDCHEQRVMRGIWIVLIVGRCADGDCLGEGSEAGWNCQCCQRMYVRNVVRLTWPDPSQKVRSPVGWLCLQLPVGVGVVGQWVRLQNALPAAAAATKIL